MRGNELKKIQRNLEEAGAPDKQTKILEFVIPTLEQDILRLSEIKKTRKLVFNQKLEIWWSKTVEKDIRPFAIREAVRTGNVYLWSAIACLVFETVIAAVIFWGMGASPWFGLLFAVVAGLILEGVVSLGLNRLDRPKETLRKIRHWVLAPAAILFGISFVLLLLARTVTGEIAVQLLPAFNTSLWTITIGLIGMAGAFLAAREVLVWSQRDEEEFNTLELEETRTKAFRDTSLSHFLTLTTRMSVNSKIEFTEEETVTSSTNGSGSSTGASAGTFGTFQAIALMLLILPWFTTSCSGIPQNRTNEAVGRQNTIQPLVAGVTSHVESDLEIYIDTSASPDAEATSELSQQLHLGLPRMIDRYNVTHVAVYSFNKDAWKASRIFFRELPSRSRPATNETKAGEIAVLPNISSAVNEHDNELKRQQSEEMENSRRQQISTLLSDLQPSTLLPQRAEARSCTDVNGLFQRIALSNRKRNRLVIVVTDGHETCASGLESSAPTGNLSLMIILVPEKPLINRHTFYQQFKTRKSQIVSTLPNATVVPYFEVVDDYDFPFEQPISK